jgi:hypothetical protein
MFTQTKLFSFKNLPDPQSLIILAPDFSIYKPRVLLELKDGLHSVNLTNGKMSKINNRIIATKIIGEIELPDLP